MVIKLTDAYLFMVVEKANPQQFQEDLMRLKNWILSHRLNSGQTNIKLSPHGKKFILILNVS